MDRLNSELNDYRQSLEQQVENRTKELVEARDALREQAIKDLLPGIFNRRYMLERLDEEIGRHGRSSSPFSIMMIDLDNFKDVNDNHGHVEGDRVLRIIADEIGRNLREHDVFGRYGGDEFLILLPDTDVVKGRSVARKLLDVTSALDCGCSERKISLSIGLAQWLELEEKQELLVRADLNMYEAKKTRNTLFC